jgi:hypothetical protein
VSWSDRRRAFAALSIGAIAAVASACGGGANGTREQDVRQQEVARRGADVMPFDLDATTHVFTKTDDGGVQRVEVDDPADRAQVALVRQHLRAEREKFREGDYDDPARIHGMDMPGVAELAAGHDRIGVTYTGLPNGGELGYRTDDPALVSALHEWFDRQVMDHGEHARAG